ncbi:hypothetical protein NLJ89_g1559 [Agrocybe chaxingu]|uniref:Uncharacterized protein n=1 Tax=Agrocybe chaxingu TaxID=84603 RepID=A0A9W8TD87_9AGAR|nr:hypothetical protein NLJ89_g1559 [Agrocybe chaxingu]
MLRDRFFMHPTQAASPMSPSHSYTVVAHGDDEDSDICPVCDGECTCHKTTSVAAASTPVQQPIVRNTTGPISMMELSMRYAATVSPQSRNSPFSGQSYPPSTPTPPTVTPAPPKPSLKIKLTVPVSMLSKHRLQSQSTSNSNPTHIKRLSKSTGETTSDCANDGYESSDVPVPPPKKRGRPPKAVVTARRAVAAAQFTRSPPYKPLNPKSAAPGKLQKRSASSKVRKNLKARPAIVKKVTAKQRRENEGQDSDSDSDSSSSPSDIDMAESSLFPTFMSASAISLSGSDSSSLSDFNDSDSSIEAEEESFILADMHAAHNKARTKRELLGGDDALQKRRAGRNSDWVIRPREKSVGGSDMEMDVDSEATEEEEEDDEDGDEEDAADGDETVEETTPEVIGMGMSMEEDEETDDHHYVGLATGWSDDDDESSFDADLFFANLSDSDSDSSSSSQAPSVSMGEEGDQSDISDSTQGPRRAGLESLPFELEESWDGQVVFTNGSLGKGLVDMEFEERASQFIVESSVSPERHIRRARRGTNDEEPSQSEMSDGGYEEEDAEAEAEGDTTDEELVGEDDLPNERAMRLFSFPTSISAINPLSTVSPAVNSVKRQRAMEKRRKRWGGESPRAADILEGRVVFWGSDEEEGSFSEEERKAEEAGERNQSRMRAVDDCCDGTQNAAGSRRGAVRSDAEDAAKRFKTPTKKTPVGPRRGVFLPSTDTKQAIIGEGRNGADVPSPHPRFKGRGRPRTGPGGGGRFSSVEHLLRRHLLQSITASNLSNSLTSIASSADDALSAGRQSDDRSPFQLLVSSTAAVAGNGSESSDLAAVVEAGVLAEPIELDDVLDASFLDDTDVPVRDSSVPPPSEDDASTSTAADAAAAKNLHRWDLISVGAFRHSTENGSWDGRHTPSSSADFGTAMKSSPLSSLLWQTGGNGPPRPSSAPNSTKIKSSKHAKKRRIMMGGSGMSSPLILPLSGDRSPNTSTPHTPTSAATALTKVSPSNHGFNDDKQKTRKETRKERKLKRKGYGPVHQQHSHHQPHQFHSHHHHPNSKSRGTNSTQRTNFFASSVPPLSL